MTCIVLDPGHGGSKNVGGSDYNHARSPSGVLEKTLTLDLAQRIRWSLTSGSGHARAERLGKSVSVVLTRDSDVNLSLDARAACAARNDAGLYLSLHFNGWDGSVRGTEAYVDRKYIRARYDGSAALEGPGDPASGLRNLNVAADAAFAGAMAGAAHAALAQFDKGAKLRTGKYAKVPHGEAFAPPPGVKMAGLGTLRDAKLGSGRYHCRACLLEIEFLDHPAVDALLNGARGEEVRNAVAAAIAEALADAA